MNYRKFCFVLSMVISVFLFVGGIFVLNYINTTAADEASADSDLLGGIVGDYKASKTPFNILVLGGDKVNKNTDTMMLVNYNPVDSKVSLMSIPRDTKVEIEGKTRKINFAFPHGGPDLVVQTVSNLLDVNIKYYVYVDTKAFRQIVDILGGVYVDIPADLNYDDPTQNLHIHLKAGRQLLNGDKAEQYMRFRKPNNGHFKEIKEFYDGSDIKRIQAQQNFIKELIKQKANILYLPKLNSVINTVYSNLETNLTFSEVTRLIKGIKNFKPENVSMFTLPGTTEDGGAWYYVCDSEKSSEITTQYFVGKGTFLNSTENQPKDTAKESAKKSESSGKKSSSKTNKSSSSGGKDVTKDNPSNPDSSLEGSTAPIP